MSKTPQKEQNTWKDQNTLFPYLSWRKKGKESSHADDMPESQGAAEDPALHADDMLEPQGGGLHKARYADDMPEPQDKGKQGRKPPHADDMPKFDGLFRDAHEETKKMEETMPQQERQTGDTPIFIKKIGDFFEKIGWPRPSDTTCCYGFFIILTFLLCGVLFYDPLDASKSVSAPSVSISFPHAGEKSIAFIFPNEHSRYFRIRESGMPWQDGEQARAAHMFSLPLEPHLMTTRGVFASRDGGTFFADVDVVFHFMPLDAVEFVRRHRLTARFNINAWLDRKLMEAFVILRPNLTAHDLRYDVYGTARTLRDILQLACEGEGIRIDGIRFRNVYKY